MPIINVQMFTSQNVRSTKCLSAKCLAAKKLSAKYFSAKCAVITGNHAIASAFIEINSTSDFRKRSNITNITSKVE